VGALAATLDWVDDDLLLVRAGGATAGQWMGTLRVTDDVLVLTTDRTKGLVFKPV
jgi:hypothetical protein